MKRFLKVYCTRKQEKKIVENWNTLFREHILERGYQYFKLGVVTDVRKTTDGYTTIVEGTEKYAVEIEV